MIPAARRFIAADLAAARSLSRIRKRPPVPYYSRHPHTRKRTFPRRPRSAAPFITSHRPVASVSRRIGGFFFAQNRPVFFLCRIFDPRQLFPPPLPGSDFLTSYLQKFWASEPAKDDRRAASTSRGRV